MFWFFAEIGEYGRSVVSIARLEGLNIIRGLVSMAARRADANILSDSLQLKTGKGRLSLRVHITATILRG